MKNNLLWNIQRRLELLGEEFLEWIEYLYHIIERKLRKREKRDMQEEYSIKEEYMEKEFVREFLKERMRNIQGNGYMMQLDSHYSSEREEEIGSVTLRCRGRLIDKAILTAGPATGNSHRLIYWNFNR